MVILLASLYLSLTALKGLGISGKALRKIMRTEIRSLRIVSMIASSYRQCCEGVEVFEVNNIKRKITGAT